MSRTGNHRRLRDDTFLFMGHTPKRRNMTSRIQPVRPQISTLSPVGDVHSLDDESDRDTIGILDTSTTSYGTRSRNICRMMLSGSEVSAMNSSPGIGSTITLCTSAIDSRSFVTSRAGRSSVSDSRWSSAWGREWIYAWQGSLPWRGPKDRHSPASATRRVPCS